MVRTAMNHAARLHSLGDVPLAAVTAASGAESAWFPMQDEEADAILEVVRAIRTGAPLNPRVG